MTTQTFPLGTVLTVTTGRLLCEMDDLYRILEFMAGEPVWTHQLPRVSDEVKPVILALYPQLEEVEVPEKFEGETKDELMDAVMEWLDEQAEIRGSAFQLAPLDIMDHTSIDPISEIRLMRPDVPVIAIEVTDDGEVNSYTCD